MTIKEMLEARAKCISDARGVMDTANNEKRDPTPEERKQFDDYMQEADVLNQKIENAKADQKRTAALEEAENSLEKSSGHSSIHRQVNTNVNNTFKFKDGREVSLNPTYNTAEYINAFNSYLRSGKPQNALQADSDEAGGYTTPQQFTASLIQDIDDLVYIRQKATKYTLVVGESLGFPSLDADPADPTWTSEIATGSEDSTMDFGKRELKPYPLAQYLKVSKKLIRCSAIPVESLVRQRLAYKIAVAEEKAFMTGSGAGQPLGVFTASSNGISTSRDASTGNTTTAITFDGLKECEYTLKAAYRNRAEWIFHRDAMKMISKLKDGEGRYIWQPSVQVGAPDMLLGKPVSESEYAPNTFTTGLYVGILGDFSNYWIADSLAASIEVAYELYMATNQNGYFSRTECDGMPVHENAFARVKLA